MSDRVKRIVGLILPLCILALFIAAGVVSVANDMYAFVKRGGEVTLNIQRESSVSGIARQLAKSGVINNPTVFCLYVESKGKADILDDFSGEITFDLSMSYREILSLLT